MARCCPVMERISSMSMRVSSLHRRPTSKSRERVREDLVNEEREKLNQEYIDSLLARYKVVIEGEEEDAKSEVVTEVSR